MKKKLIAAITSVAMVATMIPATALAAESSAPPATKTAAQAKAQSLDAVAELVRLLGTAQFTKKWKSDLDAAKKNYDALSSTEKLSVKGQEVKGKLDDYYKAYNRYVKVVDEATAALSKVEQVTKDDFAVAPPADGIATVAIAKYKALDVTDTTEGDINCTAYNFSDPTVKNPDTGKPYVNEALLAIGKLLAEPGQFESTGNAPDSIVKNAYLYLDGQKDTLKVDTSNYTTQGSVIDGVKDKIKAKPGLKDLLANYNLILNAENKVKKYENAVARVIALANVPEFTDQIVPGNVDRVQAVYDKVKAALDALADAELKGNAKLPATADDNKSGMPANEKIEASLTKIDNAIKNYHGGNASQKAANAVIDQILKLPVKANVKLTDEDAIKAARKAYDDYKAKYPGADKIAGTATATHLEDAEKGLKDAIAALEDNTATYQQRADRVLKYIKQLPSDPNKATLSHESIVASAAKEYGLTWSNDHMTKISDSRPTGTWKDLITVEQYNLLVACSEKVAELLTSAEAGLQDIKDAYDALNSGDNETIAAGITYISDSAMISKAKADIQAAKTAYANATPEAKAAFDTADKNGEDDPAKYVYTSKMVNLETGIAKAEARDATAELLGQIKLAFQDVDKADEATLAQKVAAVDALLSVAAQNQYIKDVFKDLRDPKPTDTYYGVKVEASETERYRKAKEAEIEINAKTQAAPVIQLIKNISLPDVTGDKVYTETEIDAFKATIDTAAAAFENLSDEAQEYVTNVGRLYDAQDNLKTAILAMLNKKAGTIGIISTGVSDEDKAIVEDITRMAEKYGMSGDNFGDKFSKYEEAKLKIEEADKAAAKAASDALKALVELLPETITKDSADAAISAYKQYQALTPAAKAVFDVEKMTGKTTLVVDVLKKAYETAILLDFEFATIKGIQDQTYIGNDITLNLELKDAKGATIPKDSYDVIYQGNREVGEASLIVIPKSDSKYTGIARDTFKIKAANISGATVSSIASQTYNGTQIKPSIKVTASQRTLANGKDYTVSYGSNTNKGTGTVTITGKGNYTGSKTIKFTINAKSISGASVSGLKNKVYNGKSQKQAIKVVAGRTLADKKDYNVSYSSNKAVGKATLKITAKGNYTGSITKTFRITPAKGTISSLKAGKRKMTVKVKAQSGAGYQIAYKVKGGKYKIVKSSKTTKTISKLKKGKTYTVKVRAYKKIDGKTYYGSYSKARNVRVK